MRIARMERLDLKRKEWEIISICNGIVKELGEELEVFERKAWVTEIDALVDTLEIDSERFARSAKVMEVEEDWLTEVFSRMMEHKSITVIKESTRMGEEVIEIKGSQVTPSSEGCEGCGVWIYEGGLSRSSQEDRRLGGEVRHQAGDGVEAKKYGGNHFV